MTDDDDDDERDDEEEGANDEIVVACVGDDADARPRQRPGEATEAPPRRGAGAGEEEHDA